MKSGISTSEFKGKLLLQLLVIVNIFLPYGHKLEISDEQAVVMVTGLEAAYAFARGIAKGLAARHAGP